MNCPMCGEVVSGEALPGPALLNQACQCHPQPSLGVTPEPPPESRLSDAPISLASAAAPEGAPDTEQPPATLPDAWRDELSARLSQYRARRKARPPRYPSLRLPFERVVSNGGGATAMPPPPVFEPVSSHALALDAAPVAAIEDSAVQSYPAEAPSRLSQPIGHSGAKIIEFPRFGWGPPPPPPPDQLAEPVFDRPRILEVPEIAPPPPALGGISIEAPERQEAEKRPGIDVPLLTASLARRMLANAIDGLIVVAASVLFGFVFWKVAGVQPPKFQLAGLAAGIPILFWAAYQYLLITYAANTPGLRLAGLKLARFDGTLPRRSLRRWRVLASYLSAASVGMGYAWVFLDEDSLCWHDRATRTHFARK